MKQSLPDGRGDGPTVSVDLAGAGIKTSKERPGRILASVTIAFSLIIVHTSILNVVTEPIRRDLDAGLSSIQWASSAYLIVFSCMLLPGGELSDRKGAARAYRLGLFAFGLGAALAAVAQTGWFLTFGRGVQGLGAALIIPASMSLINIVFASPAARARAIGIWVGCASACLAAGIALGGVLAEFFGWRSLFYFVLPLIGLAGWWSCEMRRPALDPGHVAHRPDTVGMVVGGAAIVLVNIACIELGRPGGSLVLMAGLAAAGALLTVLFVRLERRALHPVVPLDVLARTGVWQSCGTGALVSFGFYGLLFYVGLYCQVELRLKPIDTGLALLPMTLFSVLGNLVSVPAVVKFGRCNVIAVGGGLAALGCFLSILVLGRDDAGRLFIVFSSLIGFGVAVVVPPMTELALDSAPASRAGLVSSLLHVSRQSGAALGVGVYGAFAVRQQDHLAEMMPPMLALTALAMASVIFLALLPARFAET